MTTTKFDELTAKVREAMNLTETAVRDADDEYRARSNAQAALEAALAKADEADEDFEDDALVDATYDAADKAYNTATKLETVLDLMKQATEALASIANWDKVTA